MNKKNYSNFEQNRAHFFFILAGLLVRLNFHNVFTFSLLFFFFLLSLLLWFLFTFHLLLSCMFWSVHLILLCLDQMNIHFNYIRSLSFLYFLFICCVCVYRFWCAYCRIAKHSTVAILQQSSTSFHPCMCSLSTECGRKCSTKKITQNG